MGIHIEWAIEEVASLEGSLNGPARSETDIELAWLGQAGFAIRYQGKRFILDPYLSDYLARTCKEESFPHTRLLEIPVRPERIRGVDYVLSSHAHTDHMDPDTLKALSANNPACFFVVPAACIGDAVCWGVPRDRIIPAGAGREIVLGPDMRLLGVPSAHEQLEIDERGAHRYLGYVFQFGEVRIYHSGDCVPYGGLAECLRRLKLHVALLPINGRDAYRLCRGIAGNFTIAEALELCGEAGIGSLLVHHFGMFAFNTVADEALEDLRRRRSEALRIIVPEINQVYRIIQQRDEPNAEDGRFSTTC